MLTIGRVTLDAPFFQAGLAGYSDQAMRLIARRHGCPYAVTEAMLDQFLIHGGKGLAAAELCEADHPIAGQLMGSHRADIAAGAKILVKLGYDVIDINLACPVKKIKKKSRGGHLLCVPEEAAAILDAVRQAVGDDRPCTVKLRRGSDDSPQALRNFHHIFQKVIELGYAGAVIHGRSVEQKYLGPSNWTFLRELTQQYAPRATRHAPFFIGGSGDIWTAADIFNMIQYTHVQLVSVARGCIGNPWIFEQARALMRGDEEAATRPPTIAQQRQVLIEHFQLAVAHHGERAAGMTMRKFGIRFCRHHPDAEAIRLRFIAVKNMRDWHAVLADYYEDDGPGVPIAHALPPEAAPAMCQPLGEDDAVQSACLT